MFTAAARNCLGVAVCGVVLGTGLSGGDGGGGGSGGAKTASCEDASSSSSSPPSRVSSFFSGQPQRAVTRIPMHAIHCRDGTFVIPWATPTRATQVKQLKNRRFDVLVIGGGCVGAGVTLDAASRGLQVAMLDRDDFASGTSGRSTKLIHGGVRYLENAFWHLDYGQYLLVKEALHERGHMIWAAPYMAHALPIMVPLEQWWQLVYFRLGCFVYDMLAGDRLGVPSSMTFSKEQALFSFPMLNPSKVKGAIVYYDGQMNDTRYALAVVLTAMQSGATAANYTEVISLTTDPDTGNINGAVVRDLITKEEYTVRAKSVVNCTGPFLDGMRKMAYDATHPKNPSSNDAIAKEVEVPEKNKDKGTFKEMVIPAAGVHVVLPDHFSPAHMGLIVPETEDGRVLFFLPWEGGTLCGTTDSRATLTMLPRPTLDEVDFILRESSRYLNKPIHRSDVRSAWSGLRPLVRDVHATSEGTKAISRDHVVEISDGKMVTIGGGKWTTYRKMAEDGVDAVLRLHPSLATRAGPCKTSQIMLIGADRTGVICDRSFDVITVTLREVYGYDRDIAEHLTSSYGTRALQIAEIVKDGYVTRKAGLHPKRLVSKHPYLEAEIIFAVEQELAQRAVDVLARRTRLAFIDHAAAVEALPQIISLMAQLLNWDRARCAQEQKIAEEFLATMKMPVEN